MHCKSIFLLLIVCSTAVAASNCCIAQSRKTQEYPPTVREEVSSTWTISGKITDINGQPISGAAIYASRGAAYQTMRKNYYSMTDASYSDADGNYSAPKNDREALVVYAPGYSPAMGTTRGSQLDFQLEPGRTIRGRFLEPSGKPAVGAIVTPVTWSADMVNGQDNFVFNVPFPDFGKSLAVETDDSGEFSFEHMPTDGRVGLLVEPQGFRPQVIYVESETPLLYKDSIANIVEHSYMTDFEHSLITVASLTLEGIDDETGALIEIRDVALEPNLGRRRGAAFLHVSYSLGSSTGKIPIASYSNGAFAWVTPADSSRYLSKRIELPPIKDDDQVQRTVRFRKGKRISVRVTDPDGVPVEGATIVWRNKELTSSVDDDQFVGFDLKTNRLGRIDLAIPETEGWVGVAGNLPGFQTTLAWTEKGLLESINRQSERERHAALVDGAEVEPGDTIEIELKPSYQLAIQVVDPKGDPAPQAVVATIISVSSNRRTTTSSTRSVSTIADEQGKVLLEDWFADPFQIAVARFKQQTPLKQNAPSSRKGYPTSINAYSGDGFFQGETTVEVPGDDAPPTIPVTVSLAEPIAVEGQILSLENEPLEGVEITASLQATRSRTTQRWSTKTRADGRFRMEFIPANATLTWGLNETQVAMVESQTFAVDLLGVSPGDTVTVPPVQVMDYRYFAAPLPELHLEGVADTVKAERLKSFFEQAIERLKAKERYVPKAFRGTIPPQAMQPSIAEQHFLARVEAEAIEAIKRETKNGADLELEISLFSMIPIALLKDPGNLNGPGLLDRYLKQRILESHVNEEKVQKLLIALASEDFRNLVSGLNFESYQAQWNEVLQTSRYPETKGQIAIQIAQKYCRLVFKMLPRAVEKSKFEDACDELVAYLEQAKLAPVEAKDQLLGSIRIQLQSVVHQSKSSAERLEKEGPEIESNFKQALESRIIEGSRLEKLERLLEVYLGD